MENNETISLSYRKRVSVSCVPRVGVADVGVRTGKWATELKKEAAIYANDRGKMNKKTSSKYGIH